MPSCCPCRRYAAFRHYRRFAAFSPPLTMAAPSPFLLPTLRRDAAGALRHAYAPAISLFFCAADTAAAADFAAAAARYFAPPAPPLFSLSMLPLFLLPRMMPLLPLRRRFYCHAGVFAATLICRRDTQMLPRRRARCAGMPACCYATPLFFAIADASAYAAGSCRQQHVCRLFRRRHCTPLPLICCCCRHDIAFAATPDMFCRRDTRRRAAAAADAAIHDHATKAATPLFRYAATDHATLPRRFQPPLLLLRRAYARFRFACFFDSMPLLRDDVAACAMLLPAPRCAPPAISPLSFLLRRCHAPC